MIVLELPSFILLLILFAECFFGNKKDKHKQQKTITQTFEPVLQRFRKGLPVSG
jgi:hypothetical protein